MKNLFVSFVLFENTLFHENQLPTRIPTLGIECEDDYKRTLVTMRKISKIWMIP